MDVLTWNIFHGLARPPAGRYLLDDYADLIAGWSWDVALLQEVPPWWARPLAERSRASMRMTITGREHFLPVREWLAVRFPDAMQLIGGGSNAILVRGAAIEEHRSLRLRWLPMRRRMHAVRLDGGTWVGNIHSQTRDHSAPEPRARPQADLARAARALLGWAGAAPVVLGGDFNLRAPEWPGMVRGKGPWLDHVLARGFRVERVDVLERGTLSDHAPVRVSLRG